MRLGSVVHWDRLSRPARAPGPCSHPCDSNEGGMHKMVCLVPLTPVEVPAALFGWEDALEFVNPFPFSVVWVHFKPLFLLLFLLSLLLLLSLRAGDSVCMLLSDIPPYYRSLHGGGVSMMLCLHFSCLFLCGLSHFVQKPFHQSSGLLLGDCYECTCRFSASVGGREFWAFLCCLDHSWNGQMIFNECLDNSMGK